MIRKKNLFDLFPYLGIALFTWFFLPPDKKGSVLYCLFCLGVGLSLYAVKHEYAKRFTKKGTEVTLSDAKRAGLYALTLDENEKAELASALGHDGAKIIFSPDGKIGWRDIASLTGGVYLLFGIPDSACKAVIQKLASGAEFIPLNQIYKKLRPYLSRSSASFYKELSDSLNINRCFLTSYLFLVIYILTGFLSFLVPGLLLSFFTVWIGFSQQKK